MKKIIAALIFPDKAEEEDFKRFCRHRVVSKQSVIIEAVREYLKSERNKSKRCVIAAMSQLKEKRNGINREKTSPAQ